LSREASTRMDGCANGRMDVDGWMEGNAVTMATPRY